MVIIAGYEKDLKNCFFAYNQGLDSRFPWRFKTDDYTAGELNLIFKKKVRVLLRVFEHYPDRIAFSQIDGDFHTYTGAWDIDRVDDAIRLRITLRVRPAFFAPGFYLDRIAKGTAERSLEVIRSETLRRLQED